MPDAEKETEEKAAWNEKVDEYIQSIQWSDMADGHLITAVNGNIREFATWMRKELMT